VLSTGVAAAPPALRVGGTTPFSSIDFPGRLAAVVYVQGCTWRCGYCHNPHLQTRDAGPDARRWHEVMAWLRRRIGLIDAVVFSGGEPTLDAALPAAIDEVRALGFAIGMHSAGIYPQRLAALLPRLDWVGLDVKAPLDDLDEVGDGRGSLHDRITGVPRSAAAVRASLKALLASGVPFECRTTAHPAWLDDVALRHLADGLARRGVRHYALQLARRTGCTDGNLAAVGAGYPTPATLDRLGAMFAHFTLRGD
jgi:pyruvate formate lyase activating enzyme